MGWYFGKLNFIAHTLPVIMIYDQFDVSNFFPSSIFFSKVGYCITTILFHVHVRSSSPFVLGHFTLVTYVAEGWNNMDNIVLAIYAPAATPKYLPLPPNSYCPRVIFTKFTHLEKLPHSTLSSKCRKTKTSTLHCFPPADARTVVASFFIRTSKSARSKKKKLIINIESFDELKKALVYVALEFWQSD